MSWSQIQSLDHKQQSIIVSKVEHRRVWRKQPDKRFMWSKKHQSKPLAIIVEKPQIGDKRANIYTKQWRKKIYTWRQIRRVAGGDGVNKVLMSCVGGMGRGGGSWVENRRGEAEKPIQRKCREKFEREEESEVRR